MIHRTLRGYFTGIMADFSAAIARTLTGNFTGHAPALSRQLPVRWRDVDRILPG
jgi:hypothetical protein